MPLATVETAAAPGWARDLFPATLAPLTDAGGRPTGVWGLEGVTSDARITSQFTSEADTYHARYSASAHFQALFAQAIAACGLELPAAALILDLGSGSGVNSVLPCCNLFPGARQVATDLSGELLAILAREAQAAGVSDRVTCVLMDAQQMALRPARFDLVTGASILHHLEHMTQTLEGAARALKPGGHAIFMEPFDGYGLLRVAYERILAEAELRRAPLAPQVAAFLRDMAKDIAARTMPDRTSPAFLAMDDKWLFSRERLERAAIENGFHEVRFVPHNDHETLYRDATFTQLRLNTGSDQDLPPWAVDILDGFDRALPPPVKRLLMLEGTIVMRTRALAA